MRDLDLMLLEVSTLEKLHRATTNNTRIIYHVNANQSEQEQADIITRQAAVGKRQWFRVLYPSHC